MEDKKFEAATLLLIAMIDDYTSIWAADFDSATLLDMARRSLCDSIAGDE